MTVQIDLGPWKVCSYHGCGDPAKGPGYLVYVDLFRWISRSDGLRWGHRENFATKRAKTWAEARALVDEITPRAQELADEMNEREGM